MPCTYFGSTDLRSSSGASSFLFAGSLEESEGLEGIQSSGAPKALVKEDSRPGNLQRFVQLDVMRCHEPVPQTLSTLKTEDSETPRFAAHRKALRPGGFGAPSARSDVRVVGAISQGAP